MIIELHPQFEKAYKKRVAINAKLVKKTTERLALFQSDRAHPLLKDHALTGDKSHLRAFWITGDVRIVYQPVADDHVLFLDIGSHNQVY